MNKKLIKETAWVGDGYLKGKIKGIVIFMHGLAMVQMKDEPTTRELGWAEAGALVVHPYYGAWHWMNRQTRHFIDELVDSLYKEYRLPGSAPLIVTGESMGGQCALIYTRYAKRPVAACAVNCPVCDLEYAFHERPDVPRTIHYAFRGYSEDMKSLLDEHSPVAQASKMPGIPYMIIHGVQDNGVSIRRHSDKLVPLMRKAGLRVEYLRVPEMLHCHPVPPRVAQREMDFVVKHLDVRRP